MKYRKKPVVIEAFNYLGEENHDEFQDWLIKNNQADKIKFSFKNNMHYVKTLEGNMFIDKGDYIIIGVQNEIYPCKPDIFKETYEPVKGDE